MFEKNIYIKQAEVKGSIKQNNNGTLLINELTVNSSLKNYGKILHKALETTLTELKNRNNENDVEKQTKKKKETISQNAKM